MVLELSSMSMEMIRDLADLQWLSSFLASYFLGRHSGSDCIGMVITSLRLLSRFWMESLEWRSFLLSSFEGSLVDGANLEARTSNFASGHMLEFLSIRSEIFDVSLVAFATLLDKT